MNARTGGRRGAAQGAGGSCGAVRRLICSDGRKAATAPEPTYRKCRRPRCRQPAETHRDLAAIAEINRLMYRQATPREVLTATASGVGKHLMATRCLIAVGAAGDGMQLTSEYSSPGVPTVGAGKISDVVRLISQVTPDSLGGVRTARCQHGQPAGGGPGIGAGRDADGQGDAGAVGRAADGRFEGAEMEAERKFLFAGGGRPAGFVGESHAAAVAGAIAGGGGRKNRDC